MNLKKSFRIIDARRGDARKPSRIRDMAVRDMAVRNEKAINNAAAARNSGFVANNPWIYNLTADPNAQAVKNAVDFFDTVEHLIKQGYNDWVNNAIAECREATDLGLDRAKRTLYIWGYKREFLNVNKEATSSNVRVEYSPDKLQLRLLDYYAAIGGDASNEEMGEFIKVFNTLTYAYDEDPDERIIAFTEQFFGMVEGEFGSSEIGDSVRVSDDAYDLSLNDLREPYTGASDGKVYYWVFVNGKPYDRVFDKDAAIWKAQQYEGTGYRVSVEEFVSNGKGADPERIGVVWSNEDSIINDYIN